MKYYHYSSLIAVEFTTYCNSSRLEVSAGVVVWHQVHVSILHKKIDDVISRLGLPVDVNVEHENSQQRLQSENE